MDKSISELRAEVKDKETEDHVSTTPPVGSLEKRSEIFGNNFVRFEVNDNSDSNDSDFELEYTCDLCKKHFSGPKPLRQHERSGKHLKNLHKIKLQKEMDEELKVEGLTLFEDKTYAECNDCKKEFTGIEPYLQHLKSRSHKKAGSLKKLFDQANEGGKTKEEKLERLIEQLDQKNQLQASAVDSDEENISRDDLRCLDCEKIFTGLESFYDHMKSKTHKKILKQKELISKLITGTTSGNIGGIEINEEDIVCKICRLSFTGPESVATHLKSKGHSKMLEIRMWKKALKEKKALEESQADISENAATIEGVNEKAQVSVDGKGDLAETRENTLLCYSKYKQYTEIMKDAQSNQEKD